MSTGLESLECLDICLLGACIHALAPGFSSPALHVLCWSANCT